MILAGDVGGTKVHLALYKFQRGKLRSIRDQKFAASEFTSLDAVVKKFFEADPDSRSQIAAACFGVPGPVRAGHLKLTNLPWTLDAFDLSKSLNIEHLFLINDLEANGYGIPELDPEMVFTLHDADATAVGNRGLISAGTGLGEALLIWDGHHHRSVGSEGGHCDFPPRNERDDALLRYLRQKFKGRVSLERVISGFGLQNVYGYLRDVEKLDEPKWLLDRMAAEDPNAVISQCAEDGSSPICFEAMQIFSAAYGAEAGNLALKVLAMGGLYVGGGIAPKILKTLKSGAFIQAFLDKGRLTPLLKSIPVRIILDETCALLGAAAYAEARASEISGHSERAASTLLP
jgi:glucokinase